MRKLVGAFLHDGRSCGESLTEALWRWYMYCRSGKAGLIGKAGHGQNHLALGFSREGGLRDGWRSSIDEVFVQYFGT